MALLKAGAEADKKDADGHTALDLAPDKEVRPPRITSIGWDIHVLAARRTNRKQIKKYIERMAEIEGVEL